MRLPMITKKFGPFEGFPAPASKQTPLIQFYVGEDIILELPLFINDIPVSPVNWILTAVMKASTYDQDAVWTGVLDNGIFHKASNPSMYRIIVPAKVTGKLLPGTYWIDLIAKEPIGESNDVIDKTSVLTRLAVSLDYSAYSYKGDNEASPPAFDITQL